MDSLNWATSAAGAPVKRPLRETGDFLLILAALLKPKLGLDAQTFRISLGRVYKNLYREKTETCRFVRKVRRGPCRTDQYYARGVRAPRCTKMRVAAGGQLWN